ncbi:hypothetical protein VNI00_010374 [Paramarasmius palmivorus]|uniref:Uncharacterized protein n=1 Tax=Paramarasmius palmivorus TaxID=297713 RepID=A0AAW0CIR2_9AGAR
MTRRDMGVQTTPLNSAKASDTLEDAEEIVQQEQALKQIRKWNKTLKMSKIKRSGPWELDDLPVQYRPPIPSLRRYHTPPFFIFGIPFTEEDIFEINRQLGRYEESLNKSPVSQNFFLRGVVQQHAEEACETEKYKRTVDWRLYYSKDEDTEMPLFLCVARSYDPGGFRNLHRIAKKLTEAFPYLNKRPMWYLDALENDLEKEDWRIKGIPGLSVQTTYTEEPESAQDSEQDSEETARQERALETVLEWNETLWMRIIKESGPWEPKDLPIQYRPPIPSLRQHHSPPVFIFGIPLTSEEIIDITKNLGRYEEVLREDRIYQNFCCREIILKHVEEGCEMSRFRRAVDWRVYYSKEKGDQVPFFLCFARSYDPRGFRDLREIARRATDVFPELNKHPMWYLDAIHNDLEREDWRIKGIPGLSKGIVAFG